MIAKKTRLHYNKFKNITNLLKIGDEKQQLNVYYQKIDFIHI
jgi:hypothetical protein